MVCYPEAYYVRYKDIAEMIKKLEAVVGNTGQHKRTPSRAWDCTLGLFTISLKTPGIEACNTMQVKMPIALTSHCFDIPRII